MKHLDFMIIDMLCLQVAFILSYNAVVRIYFICAKNYMETDIKKIQFGYK